MKKLVWSLTSFGLLILMLPVNGVMEYDEIERFTDFNGTKVIENDVHSEANVLWVPLTLIQSGTENGAGNIF